MNRILVNTYLKQDDRIASVMSAEFEMTDRWKAEGVIEHLFAKENGGGAVVIFNEIDESKVRELMAQLPLFPYWEKIEYLSLDKLY